MDQLYKSIFEVVNMSVMLQVMYMCLGHKEKNVQEEQVLA